MRSGLAGSHAWLRRRSASRRWSRERQSADDICTPQSQLGYLCVVSLACAQGTWQVPGSVLFEDERQLWASGNPVARLLLIPRLDLVGFEDAVAGIIDREQVRIHGIALRMTNTLRLLETNFQRHSSRVNRTPLSRPPRSCGNSGCRC